MLGQHAPKVNNLRHKPSFIYIHCSYRWTSENTRLVQCIAMFSNLKIWTNNLLLHKCYLSFPPHNSWNVNPQSFVWTDTVRQGSSLPKLNLFENSAPLVKSGEDERRLETLPAVGSTTQTASDRFNIQISSQGTTVPPHVCNCEHTPPNLVLELFYASTSNVRSKPWFSAECARYIVSGQLPKIRPNLPKNRPHS